MSWQHRVLMTAGVALLALPVNAAPARHHHHSLHRAAHAAATPNAAAMCTCSAAMGAACGCATGAAPAATSDVAKKPEPKISFGGELRLRSETLVNMNAFQPLRSDSEDDSFVLLRARVHADATPIEGLRVYLEPQFSRVFAQDESTVFNTAPATPVHDVDLHQGYVEFNKLADGKVAIRAGRQELAYGDQRLIGSFGWSNVGRNFDAVKVRGTFGDSWVDGFASWIQRVAGNQYFGGVYGHWQIAPKMENEPYVLMLRDNDGGGVVGGVDVAQTVYTIGDRFATTLANRVDLGAEGAVQVGKIGANSILAYAGHVNAGYTFDNAWKPRIAAEYNVASGDDDPASGKIKTFNNLFPTNHDKYGYFDLVGWRNIHDPSLSFRVSPAKNFTAELGYHAFFLMQPADGLYQASGAKVRAGAAGASRFAGQEADLLLKYDWKQVAQFQLGYSFFKAGKFLGDTGTKRDAHFVYAQTSVKF